MQLPPSTSSRICSSWQREKDGEIAANLSARIGSRCLTGRSLRCSLGLAGSFHSRGLSANKHRSRVFNKGVGKISNYPTAPWKLYKGIPWFAFIVSAGFRRRSIIIHCKHPRLRLILYIFGLFQRCSLNLQILTWKSSAPLPSPSKKDLGFELGMKSHRFRPRFEAVFGFRTPSFCLLDIVHTILMEKGEMLCQVNMVQPDFLEPSTCNMNHTQPVPQHLPQASQIRVQVEQLGPAARKTSASQYEKRNQPIFNDLITKILCVHEVSSREYNSPQKSHLGRGARPNFVGDSLRAKSCSTLQGSETVIHPEIYVYSELM